VAASFDVIARVCDAMVVVVGHEANAVIAALGDRRFLRREVGSAPQHMFISVRVGLRDVCHEFGESVQVLLHPADHPTVRYDVLEAMIQKSTEKPHCAIMPTYRGKGGHPVLIPSNLIERILSYQGPSYPYGLRQFWLDHSEQSLRLAVDDPGVIFDVDTQLDYDLGVQ
jgi:molybdenum cofactor cytidylyltransferase